MAERRDPELTPAQIAAQENARALAEALENPATEVDPKTHYYVTADGRKVRPDGSEFKGKESD